MDNMEPKDPRLPVANYSSAIARAVDWLGIAICSRDPSMLHGIAERGGWCIGAGGRRA